MRSRLDNESEAVILKRVMLEASRLGCTVFRNSTGMFRAESGQVVRTGLCVGSADLIGWLNGRFLAIEVKRKGGKLRPEQENFLKRVNMAGGIGIVCDDEKNLKNLLNIS